MITVALSFSARPPKMAIANWASVICTCMLQQEETDVPGQTRGARYIATVHATEVFLQITAHWNQNSVHREDKWHHNPK
jgi:hypothetical protein